MRINAAVPREIADELEGDGHADVLQFRGGFTVETAFQVLDSAAVLITLTQGPAAIKAMVRSLQRHLGHRKKYTLKFSGEKGAGEVLIDIDEGTDVDWVVKRVEELLTP